MAAGTTLRFSMKNYRAIPERARELLEGRCRIRSIEGMEYVFQLSDKTAAEVLAVVPEQLAAPVVEDRAAN